MLGPGVRAIRSAAPTKRRKAEVDGMGAVLPNVRANRPAEASAVSLVRDDAPCAADQAYGACRSGSG